MSFKSSTRHAQNVTVGAFLLPRSMVSAIEGGQDMPATEEMIDKLTPTIKDKTQVVGGRFYVRTKAKKKDFNTGKAKVGDLRVSFKLLEAAEVSVVAKQSGSSFAAYQAKAGGTLSMIETGKHSADSMFKAAKEANSSLTWILRGVGWFLMALGIGLVVRPLSVIAAVIPLFGSILAMGVFLLAIAVATPLSLLTIAIAWIVARPLVGGLLLAAVVAIIVGLVVLVRKRKAAKQAAQPQAAAAAAGAAGFPGPPQAGPPPQQGS